MKHPIILLLGLILSLSGLSQGLKTDSQITTDINAIRTSTGKGSITRGEISDILQSIVYSKGSIIEGFTASGTDTYAATVSSAITAYTPNLAVKIKFTNANTGAATINLNSLGTKSIVKTGGTALAAGDIHAGQSFILQYDGTNFQIFGDGGTGGGGGSGTVTSLSSSNGALSISSPTTTPVLTINSAPILTTARTINGTSFDGSSNITVTAAAGTLTGSTLASGVTASSLTSVGTLTGGATGSGFTIALGTSTITGTIGPSNLANTAVTPGSYTNLNATIDAQGRITAASNGSGSGTPGGSTTQIQFNNSGSFAGNSNFTINNGTGVVTFGVAPIVPTGTPLTGGNSAASQQYVDDAVSGGSASLPLSIANGGTGASTASAHYMFGRHAGTTGAPSFASFTWDELGGWPVQSTRLEAHLDSLALGVVGVSTDGYVPASGNANAILKGDGSWLNPTTNGFVLTLSSGAPVWAAAPSYTFSTGLTNTSGTITNNLSVGVAGGQTMKGGLNSGDDLTITSTNNATKGNLFFGSGLSTYDEVNDRWGISQVTPTAKLHINTNALGTTQTTASGIYLENSTASISSGATAQVSPSLTYYGSAWGTVAGTSQAVIFRTYMKAVTGSAATGQLITETSVAGGAFGTILTLFNNGTITTPSAVNMLQASLSSTAATALGMAAGAGINFNGAGTLNFNNITTANATGTIHVNGNGTVAPTTGTREVEFGIGSTFAPASGAIDYAPLAINPTINQTSTANGNTQGIYIDPTFTSILGSFAGVQVKGGSWSQSSGNKGNYSFSANPTYNTTGSYSGGFAVGYNFIPTVTSSTGLTIFSFFASSGAMLLGNSALDGTSYTAGTKLDVRGFGSTTGFTQQWLNVSNTQLAAIRDDGSMVFGSSAITTNALLDLQSTTKALVVPRMTTTQRDAIGSPSAGMIIYNTTTNKLNVYTTAWEAVTSI